MELRLLAAALLVGCVAEEPAPTSETPDPPAWVGWSVLQGGPQSVGRRDQELTYEPLPGESRTIHVYVRYPVAFGETEPAPSVHTRGYPVLAFSHGDQSVGVSAEALMGFLASHGWVAISVDHTDNLLGANVDPTPQGHWYHRPRDLSAALDWLEADPALADADTDRTVIAGHSRGGSTMWSLVGATFDPGSQDAYCPDCSDAQLAAFDALADERMAAGMLLASTRRTGLFGETGHTTDLPLLMVTGTEDPIGQQAFFDEADSLDLTWVDIEDGCHETPTTGLCPTLGAAEGFDIVNAYALAFARARVLDDASDEVVGILDGTVEVDPRAALQTR